MNAEGRFNDDQVMRMVDGCLALVAALVVTLVGYAIRKVLS
jgi:hypothetical protein